MSVEQFIDSNILLYHLDDADPAKHEIASKIVVSGLQNGRSCISYQVVQECLNAGLRKAHIPLDDSLAMRYPRTVLMPLCKVFPNIYLYQRGLDVRVRYGFSFYDSLIVSAALAAGCTSLLSEDLQHGQRVDQLTIENPLLSI